MQIANGMVILSPENHQFKHGITPAEALIIYNLHRQYANGTPLGEFFIQPGEALTVEAEGKAAEEEYFNPNAGKIITAKPAIPARTHKRTQTEEIARLKKKYTGIITKDGVAQPAFAATFGNALGLRLPETFEEIEEAVGIKFQEQAEPVSDTPEDGRTRELLAMPRPALCALAVDTYHLPVKVGDTNERIAAAIVSAEKIGQDTAPKKSKPKKDDAPVAAPQPA
jgi:hypothetical protein